MDVLPWLIGFAFGILLGIFCLYVVAVNVLYVLGRVVLGIATIVQRERLRGLKKKISAQRVRASM